jgi:hypothetical protein
MKNMTNILKTGLIYLSIHFECSLVASEKERILVEHRTDLSFFHLLKIALFRLFFFP